MQGLTQLRCVSVCEIVIVAVSCELQCTLLFSGHTPDCDAVLTACQKAANKLISIFKSPIDSKYLPLFLIDFCISGGISVDASFRKPSLVGSFNLPAPRIKGHNYQHCSQNTQTPRVVCRDTALF